MRVLLLELPDVVHGHFKPPLQVGLLLARVVVYGLRGGGFQLPDALGQRVALRTDRYQLRRLLLAR